jgi:PIN domain nuclease of toxin-antitoxin system
MSVVLDTCAVLWLTLNPSEFSGKAHKVIASADHLLWTKSVLLKWVHRGHADRLIVSQAQQLEAVLITDDKELKKFYQRCVA